MNASREVAKVLGVSRKIWLREGVFRFFHTPLTMKKKHRRRSSSGSKSLCGKRIVGVSVFWKRITKKFGLERTLEYMEH